MKFQELAAIVADEPLFESGLLLAARSILPRCAASSRADPEWADPSVAAEALCSGAALEQDDTASLPRCKPPFPRVYVSGLSALAFAHAIPEYVAEVTSVSTGRPMLRHTPLGRFSFRHLKAGLMFGYRLVDLGQDQRAFVAEPEKALLDVVHLQPDGDGAAAPRGAAPRLRRVAPLTCSTCSPRARRRPNSLAPPNASAVSRIKPGATKFCEGSSPVSRATTRAVPGPVTRCALRRSPSGWGSRVAIRCPRRVLSQT